MAEIPEEDLKVIKKYSKGQIFRLYQKEESLQQQKKDLFYLIFALIFCVILISIFLLDKYYYNSVNYYIYIVFFIPLILIFSIISLGYYYGRTSKYQIVFSSEILLLILVLEYAYMYINFNYKLTQPQPINPLGFIILSSMGVFSAYCFGSLSKIFINETDDGKSENFDIEVLSHADTENLEPYEKLINKYINYIISLRQLSQYDDKNSKILQKAGLDDTFLLYVISKNVFAFFLFMKKGRYIYQDKKSIEIQKRISFLLKNSLNFNDAGEKHRVEGKASCIEILSRDEMNNLAVYIGTYKREAIGLILIFTVGFIVYLSYPLDIILKGIKTILSNTIVPQILILVVTGLYAWFISKQNK